MTGSWSRTLAAIGVLVVLAAILSTLTLSGRFADLRYADIPWLRPWPPQGFAVNPLNPTDRGDIINLADAAKVRSDLLADGRIEVDAYAHGLTDPLSEADTGRALAKAVEGVISNNHAGLYEVASSQLESVEVGRLPDPNQTTISWCVVERGVSTLTFVAQSSGTIVRTESFRFEGKFWLARVNGRVSRLVENFERLERHQCAVFSTAWRNSVLNCGSVS